jgi:branched-chain amino acid transport system substrate-binding protein
MRPRIGRRLAVLASLAVACCGAQALAQGEGPVKLGVLNDRSSVYADIGGDNSVEAVRMAVEDFGGSVLGKPIEVVFADHQNKPDVGASVARQWYDTEGVDVITDVPTSSVALAVEDVSRQRRKLVLFSGAGSSDITGKNCSPYAAHWTYDTYALANGTGSAVVKQGGDSWFFITADYAFGHALERDTANFVRHAGGKILGSARTPFPGTTDFSSFLVQAAAARPKVIGLANAGSDTVNCIKQAAEFGLGRRGIRLASLLMFMPDVHAIGLQTAQGLICTETFYWDLNDRTRAFTRRMRPQVSVPLCMNHAGGYAAVLHYLKTVADMGVAQAKASGLDAVNRMKAMPCDDDCFGPGRIREDGRKLHPAYLFEVKKPEESRGEWDYYKLLQTTPGEEAFRPLAEGGCQFLRS